jgi:prevent-host-death family protein
MTTGVRNLKNKLSHYIRQVESGKRVVITAHGRVVVELVPPLDESRVPDRIFDRLVALGFITPPSEAGDPLEGAAAIRLPRGAAAALLDSDRGEA